MLTNHMTPYYEPSGRMPVGGIVLFLLGGIVAAWILGIVYTYVLAYIPSVYISVLGTFGFGVGIGVVCNRLVKSGKLRAPSHVTVLAAIVTCVGLWLHWAFFCAHFVHRYHEDSPGLASLYLLYLQSPAAIITLASVLFKVGHFTVSGTNITGVVLAGLWLIEAGLVFAMVILLARGQAKEPYSETCDCWAEPEKLPRDLPFITDVSGLKNALEYGDMSPLLTAAKQSAADSQHATLTLHAVEDDPECRYLTLVNVTVTTDKKGKQQRKNTPVVQYLRVSPEKCRQLRATFGTNSQPEENRAVM